MQFRKLALATEEGGFAGSSHDTRNKKWCASGSKRTQNVTASRAILRIPSQQVHTEIAEILRRSWIYLSWLNGSACLLAEDYFKGPADERQSPRQSFVQHDPDAVPITRARNWKLCPLLGGHVIRSANQQRVTRRWFNIFNETKIENDDAPFVSDKHIRGLDVAMKLAQFVKVMNTFGQLPQCEAQA